jgi:hypothetical protein
MRTGKGVIPPGKAGLSCSEPSGFSKGGKNALAGSNDGVGGPPPLPPCLSFLPWLSPLSLLGGVLAFASSSMKTVAYPAKATSPHANEAFDASSGFLSSFNNHLTTTDPIYL